jgi:hypothetical protein
MARGVMDEIELLAVVIPPLVIVALGLPIALVWRRTILDGEIASPCLTSA